MRRKKLIGLFMMILVSGVMLFGCNEGSRNEDTSGVISNEDAKRLPDTQQDVELEKILAKLRKVRKEGLKVENGSMSATGPSSIAIPGAPKNEPIREYDEYHEIGKVTLDYVIKKLNISADDKETINKLDIANCIDPRMTAIYDDEDKGIAKGYENKNIYVMEYEESKDKYMYVIFVRESDNSDWKVLKEGLTYKES